MQVFGHRGAAGEAPENTIAGVRHTIATGISRIEIDLRLTGDLQLVVLHDRNLKRTTGIDKNIDQLTAAELQTLVGSNVPTLATLLAAAPELECVQLEIKSDQSTNAQALAQALAKLFPDAQSARRFVVTSFDSEIIDAVAGHAPQLRRGLVAKREAAHALATARELHCDYLCLHYKLVSAGSPDLIAALNASELHVSCWTVNGPRIASALAKRGVASIITDIPTKLLPHVQKINRASGQ